MHSDNYHHLAALQGILVGVFNDYKEGHLGKLKGLIRADVFGDFLEMAEYLLNDGYRDAAAVLIGSVLEDTMRNIAILNSISAIKPNGDPKTINSLNQDLYKNDIYNKLVNKEVTTWGDLRNKAAHGKYDQYDKDQVKRMLSFVQKFCQDFLV